MTEPLSLALLFGVGIIAGFLNVIAGGGSTIVLPLLIFMGMDAGIANGTNRVGILMQNISAVTSFHQRDHSEFNQSFKLSLAALPGAIAGSLTAVRVSDEVFQQILAVVMIGVVITMLLPQPKNNTADGTRASWWVYPAMVGVGFYGGFIQVGVGFLFMASLYHLMHISLVRVNMHKVFIVLIYSLPTLLVFFLTDKVHWIPGIALGVGSALGGWWAAHVSVKKGDTFIRGLLIAAILLMAAKLLFW